MYSLTARFNKIVFFTSCTLAVLSLMNQATAFYFENGEPKINFNVISTDKFHHYKSTHYNGGKTDWDQVTFKFYLDADLEPIFTWNLKQLYFYVNVHYKSDILQSDAIIYDKIISRPDLPQDWKQASQLVLKNQRAEYALKDIHKSLRNQTIDFEIWAEVMPYVGFITRRKLAVFPHQLPEIYS